MSAGPKNHYWGIACLVAGGIALAFAVIPPVASGRPLRFPWQAEEQPPAPREVEVRVEPQVTLKVGRLKVGLGEKKVEVPRPEPVAQAAPPADPLRWYAVAAAGCAVVGLVLVPIAWVKRNHPAFALTALPLCTLALTWQYIAVGIAAGAAVAACLVVLAMLAGVLEGAAG